MPHTTPIKQSLQPVDDWPKTGDEDDDECDRMVYSSHAVIDILAWLSFFSSWWQCRRSCSGNANLNPSASSTKVTTDYTLFIVEDCDRKAYQQAHRNHYIVTCQVVHNYER
jgi:hypothetical protein